MKDSIPLSVEIYRAGVKIRSFALFATDSISLDSGVYLLKVSSSGYKSMQKTFSADTVNVPFVIKLASDPKNLQGVTVVSRRALVRTEDDKSIVDAEPLATTSTNAYEILEKTPGAVMVDGNIYLNSATPAKVYINGRDSKMNGDELGTLLKNLPANAVLKIEILKSPSAKYDASSTGGILNVVLKKGYKPGRSGSVNSYYSQGKYDHEGIGLTLNDKGNRLNYSLSYNFNRTNNYQLLQSTQLQNNSKLMQDAYSKYPSITNVLRGNMDFELNKKVTFTYELRINYSINKTKTENTIGRWNAVNDSMDYQGLAINNFKTKNRYFNNEIGMVYNLDTLGSKWESDFTYSNMRGPGSQDYSNNSRFPFTGLLNSGFGDVMKSRNFFEFNNDFTLKTKSKFTIETGAQMQAMNFKSRADFSSIVNGSAQKDVYRTNNYSSDEKSLALYLQVSKTIAGFNIKPGLRMESYVNNGHEFVPYDTVFKIKRTDFFPYLYVRHKLFSIFGMTISGNGILRRSIERPSFSQLNPAPTQIDQFLFSIGRPTLRPQFTKNYEFNITADDYPIVSIGYKDNNDLITPVTYSGANNIIYNTYDNVGRNKEFYMTGTAGIPPGGKYFFFAGAQYNKNHYQGQYEAKPLDYTNETWLFFSYHSYKISNNTNVSAFGFYRLKSLEKFYELQPFGMVNMSLSQNILKGKGNVVLSMNDIFKTMKFDFRLNQGSINAFGIRENDSRKFTLKFVYNFGVKPKRDNTPAFGAPVLDSN